MDPARKWFEPGGVHPAAPVTPLSARLESQVREEAKQAGCSYLLLTTFKHQRKTGGTLLRRMAGGAAEQGAWSVAAGAGSTAGRIAAGAAAGAGRTAAWDYAHHFRTKDELTLAWRLEGPKGEDLLTPLVQSASEAIAAAVAGS